MSKCSSRQSHSDYCSVYSSDEESTSSPPPPPPPIVGAIPAGVCPHCHKIFEQPVTLQCGHSLCRACCDALLRSSSDAIQRPTTRPRMGVSSWVSSSRRHHHHHTINRTPACLVCGAAASPSPPIPNLELDNFLRNIKSVRWCLDEPRQRKWEDEGVAIHECKIAVVGARGVGKTCLARVQYGNEIMFPDLSDDGDDSDSYIIDIIDGMDVNKSFTAAHGIIVVYSIADRSTFYEACEIYRRLENGREHNQPLVLVGSKKDKEKRREVTSSEGQQLARAFGCPFYEVSAKRNDSVHEMFTDIVTMIQKQQNSFRLNLEQTLQ
ncbi:unnamed protein product [Caenorhabditis bovis]|uniref:small monomeric GTPase n=1 Tax=Caenorhabditis bovis TaxID=2654633 RepID=A0A8S1F094_9PELO|nr:unnamed protein product [Caenorhabditis bovis]